MIWIALRMLIGNHGKYLAIIMGVTFSSWLISQQSSIFCGLLRQTCSQIRDITGGDIWVMDKNVQFIDDIKPLSESDFYRIRGVPGIEWAVRLYKGYARARIHSGRFQQVILIGLDDATLIGAPPLMLVGQVADLKQPDAVIMDEAGFMQLWPGEPLRPGKTFEMNDHLARVVGICRAGRTFQTFPVIYSRYTAAVRYAPRDRKVMSFVLANPAPGLSSAEVCRRINLLHGLRAETRDQFMETTVWYFMKQTGIPINFGMTVALGFIVGAAIAGQTFYLFTIENLKQFGALKAMGTSNWTLLMMIVLQAFIVGAIGYGIGIGLAAAFGEFAKTNSKLAFYMPWEVMIGTGVAVVLMIVLSSIFSLIKVLRLDPAVVFQG